MSYPGGGYPPYPPNPHGGGGYPQPYQTTTPLSYPVYPGSAAPTGPISGYPGQPSPYPSPYPNSQPSPYPSQPAPYPSSQPAPYPGGNSAPYPGGQPAPYPSQPAPYPSGQPAPYPGGNSAPYPGGNSAPYPGSNSAPYSGGNSASYPGGNSAPYPGGNSAPYPGGNSAPYPGGNQSSPYSGGQASSHPPLHSTPHYGGGGAAPQGQAQHTYSKGSPTVRPANPFDPRTDAEALRKAMKGFGTDEKAIIQVLTKRSNAQRQEIAKQFKTLYGKDLISNLKSELSGNFEDLVLALMTPVPEFQAREIHHAIQGIGTNENTLVELLCSATNQEIHGIRAAYERLFYSSLEKDLEGDTSGSFRRLMISLCQGRRDENYRVDHHSAVQDAQALLNAGELQLGTDESTFNAILCTRSYPQLIQICMEYQRLAGHGIEKAIKGEFSGDIESGLLAIIKCVKDKAGFFAEQLHDSMAGAGTKDRALIRMVTIRSEIDMEDIKRAFHHKYGQTLADWIREDCSGHMEKALLSLIDN